MNYQILFNLLFFLVGTLIGIFFASACGFGPPRCRRLLDPSLVQHGHEVRYMQKKPLVNLLQALVGG